MRKKFFAVLMATIVALSLVGCTGDKNKETSTGDASNTDEKIKTTLTVWGPSEDQSTDYGNWLQTMCEQFNAEHPNWDLTFKYDVCPEGEAKATVTQDVEGAADVYMFANDNLTDLLASKAIAKLGGETADYVKSTNSQAIIDSVSVNGDVYGVPFTTNTWFMYYNTKMFTEDEASNLDKMISKGKISFPITDSWYIASFYVANGCTLFGDGTDEAAGIDFAGDKGVAVTNYLIDMVNSKNFINGADGAGISALRDGSAGAMFSGSWDYEAAKEALGENFGVRELPTVTIDGKDKQLMSFAGSKAIGVNPNSKYQQVAVALAKYLGGAEAQKKHYELRSVVPCNTELLKEDVFQKDALVVAQNKTFDTTSIIQPFVAAMGNYWDPAANFGKAIVNGDVNHDNAEAKTKDFNISMNTSVVE